MTGDTELEKTFVSGSDPIVAIDPGIDTGVAIIGPRGELTRCWLGLQIGGYGPQIPAHYRAIIEKPQAYSAKQSTVDANDLITLAIQVGEYKADLRRQGSRVALVVPFRWKKQVPKDVYNRRVLAALDEHEIALLDEYFEPKWSDSPGVPKGKRHNVIDAIALGKWAYQHQKELWPE